MLRLLIYSQLKPVYEQICDIIQDRLEGLKENWRNDLQAGLQAFRIALPLCLYA